MKTNFLAFVGVLSTSLLITNTSCDRLSEEDGPKLVLPSTPYEYFGGNQEAKIGRVLFYDVSLSDNNQISCGSCHKQSRAFADDRRFSLGIEDQEGRRNTPPIQNIDLHDQLLFWDGRENQLQEMVLQPIFDHTEMGISSEEELLRKVSEKEYYQDFFKETYGEITIENIGRSLGAFITSIRSNNSKFEMRDEPFTSLESEGEALFFGDYNCGNCHNVQVPQGYNGASGGFDGNAMVPGQGNSRQFNPELQSMANIGLEMEYKDIGEGEVFETPEAVGRFKVPNLRNVALTAPYMHDGRFETLEEVIDHYSEGVEDHPNLDERLKDENGKAIEFNIPEEDKKALIAFMNTLTDNRLITDPKFSDPFIE